MYFRIHPVEAEHLCWELTDARAIEIAREDHTGVVRNLNDVEFFYSHDRSGPVDQLALLETNFASTFES